MDEAEVARFGREFTAFLEAVNRIATPAEGSPVRAAIEEHLGRDADRLPVVADRYLPFEHVNVQVAVEHLLAQPGRSHRLVGLLGDQHGFMSLAELLQHAHHRGVGLGAVDYVSLADGPGSVRLCAQAGLYLLKDDGRPVALLLRAPSEHGPRQLVSVEVLAPERAHGEALVAELRELSVRHSVFRNQVLTFSAGPFGEQTAGPIAFQPRPQLRREDVVLLEATFARIEAHVFGIAEQRDRLLASGQHVKRGLLLHGPPGTGKTLTARYLISQVTEHTVVVLSGTALHHIGAAAALARTLQPALVVLEDVDLVAQERMPPYASPLLFELLNVMDGLDEDADITFLLTTNRADVLEPALAARPGRVDEAVEIPLPDAESRRRLLQLYAAGVDLHADDIDAVVERTEGVTASFIKELVRKAALTAAQQDGGSGPVTVTDEHLGQALDVLLDEGAGLTRALLGIGQPGALDPGDAAQPGLAPPNATGWFAYAPMGRPHRRYLR